MPTDVELMIREAVLSADASADESKIALTIAGVSRDPAWRDLLWLSREQASGTLAVGLAKRATEIAAAISAASVSAPPAQEKPIHERFEMSAEEFRKLPPTKKRELAEEAAKFDAREEQGSDVTALKAKQTAGTLSLTEKLTLARLENPAPTREQRRDPQWIRAQQVHASVETLERLKRGHDSIWPSGNYPESLRDHHKAESERLAALIAEKKAAANV